MDAQEITRNLKQRAGALGFELSGAAPAVVPPGFSDFLRWIQRGYAGEMTYLERRKNERGNPGGLLPGAKSVFCLGLSYNPRPEHHPLLGKHPVSCYAWGRDYHEVLNEKLEVLARYLCQDLAPGSHAKWFVDSGSILEKDFAALAGLGWIGKNTLLLNGKHGSFLFLGEILTDAELACDTDRKSVV